MSIILNNIYYRYKNNKHVNTALDGIDLEINAGEYVLITGMPGAGKTTLLKIICGLLKPDSGGISFSQGTTGYIPQYPEHMFFNKTVYEEISFGPGNAGLSKQEVDNRVRDSMEITGLDFKTFSERSPFSLSAGEMRKCAIASVVSRNPGTIVSDEPFSGLDEEGVEKINGCFEKINSRGATVILTATGEVPPGAARRRKARMEKGKIP
jgi:energy-coupling factor transport system ATP-binding protein